MLHDIRKPGTLSPDLRSLMSYANKLRRYTHALGQMACPTNLNSFHISEGVLDKLPWFVLAYWVGTEGEIHQQDERPWFRYFCEILSPMARSYRNRYSPFMGRRNRDPNSVNFDRVWCIRSDFMGLGAVKFMNCGSTSTLGNRSWLLDTSEEGGWKHLSEWGRVGLFYNMRSISFWVSFAPFLLPVDHAHFRKCI